MRSTTFALALLLAACPAAFAQPQQVALSLPDQFERIQEVGQFRGDVLILLYGDRGGMTANKTLGEKLHVHYHPGAKDKPPAEAAKAPVVQMTGLAQGARSPDVKVVPVACIGKVPDLVKGVIRGRFKKDVPDTAVLLDFENKMKDQFGLKDGEPNLLLIDTQGRLRMKVAGEMDQATYDKLIQAVDYLRKQGGK